MDTFRSQLTKSPKMPGEALPHIIEGTNLLNIRYNFVLHNIQKCDTDFKIT